MLRIQSPVQRRPRQWTRRDVLCAGSAGLGLSLPKLWAAESQASDKIPKAKSVIFLMLFGGPSQLETFDLKPEAPEAIRGPFQPIASQTPELLIGEHLPHSAQVSDKFSVIRTMSHSFNDHSGGGHYLQTGHRWHIPIGGGFSPTPQDWPSLGSIVEYQDQAKHGLGKPLPAYMVVPNSLGRLQQAGQYPRPGEHAGWLGQRYNPLTTKVDKKSLTDNPYWRDCSDDELTYEIAGIAAREGITVDRLGTRRSLLEQFDTELQRSLDTPSLSDYEAFQERVFGLLTSETTRNALNIRRETAKLRDQYGRHLFGQSCLMARRLVEAGVRFVTVHYECIDGYSWDSHRNSDDVKKHLLPTFDQAYAALLQDLDERGMLSETLVVATGEMGRTPKANANWGRDHWSTLFSTVLAGGGVAGGRVHGSSDKNAAYATDTPVSPEDLAATIYHAMGIDHDMHVMNAENRPTQIVDGGAPVMDLFA